jgi:hypothetical protein
MCLILLCFCTLLPVTYTIYLDIFRPWTSNVNLYLIFYFNTVVSISVTKYRNIIRAQRIGILLYFIV